MTINEHKTTFAGKRVVLWEPGEALPDPEQAICRISLSYEDSDEGKKWGERFGQFLESPGSSEIVGLVIGAWEEVAYNEDDAAQGAIDALIAARDRLPKLTALFFGDIIMEESEISWITQGNVGPLLAAYPQLEHFGIRGGSELTFGAMHHQRLQTLIVETGGLPATVAQEVASAELPELRHLELWLGTEHYGGDATIDDLAPILNGEQFLKLAYLGLRDSENADAVAAAVATAPILERIAVLDLSLGTLGDEGAAALAASPAVAKLQKLDIHHHYCTDEGLAPLRALPIELDDSEPQEEDEHDGEYYRYPAVTE